MERKRVVFFKWKFASEIIELATEKKRFDDIQRLRGALVLELMSQRRAST